MNNRDRLVAEFFRGFIVCLFNACSAFTTFAEAFTYSRFADFSEDAEHADANAAADAMIAIKIFLHAAYN